MTLISPVIEAVPHPTPPNHGTSTPNWAPSPPALISTIAKVPYPTPPIPSPSTPYYSPVVDVVMVVITCIFPKAPPSAPPAPIAVKSTVCPKVAPKSTVWLIIEVVNVSFTVYPVLITPKLVAFKSTVSKLVIPKSTVPKWVVPKSTASWAFVPKSVVSSTVVDKKRPSAPAVATDPCLIDFYESIFLQFLALLDFLQLLW